MKKNILFLRLSISDACHFSNQEEKIRHPRLSYNSALGTATRILGTRDHMSLKPDIIATTSLKQP
jgi:hypothetical protein